MSPLKLIVRPGTWIYSSFEIPCIYVFPFFNQNKINSEILISQNKLKGSTLHPLWMFNLWLTRKRSSVGLDPDTLASRNKSIAFNLKNSSTQTGKIIQACWPIPVISGLRRLRQEDHWECKTSQGHVVRSCFKISKQTKN